jgi:hypothetical protein
MKVTVEQFRKKVEDLDKSWLFLKYIEDLNDQERQTLIQHGISDFDNIVVVHFENEFDWFLVALSGIYILQKGKLKFIKYKEISGAKILIDFQQKNPKAHPKIAADTLRLRLINGELLYLKCSDVGAVYTLDRVVSYGIRFVASRQ